MKADSNQIDQYPVHHIVMPLVKVLRDANLSWADKQIVADAITSVMRHKKSMQEEAMGDQLTKAMGARKP